MRPVRLDFEGFTAFREPTTVDFEGADLFALTGPTGSGKTSVLDAVVFALYGTVPRLDRREVAPIISQGMAEARVRLDFTMGNGEYTATRVVRRTKTGANTAEARLECSGEVLAGNADELTATVGELLGLSYEHFTKCVVLPQGEFARFLHDKPRDRQDLLVTLLDLGVYGRMAELAGRRSADAKSQAAVLAGRLSDLAGATPEAIAAAEARVECLSLLVAELDAAVPELDALNDEVAEAKADAGRLATEATRLSAIALPDGLDELHDRLTVAAARVADADAEMQVAEAAAVSAEAAAAALPDPSHLILVREAHDLRTALLERHAKDDVVLAERRSDQVATSNALLAAERGLAEAREAEAAAAAAHRAHAVRADLVVGEPCPVCLQEVGSLPETAAAPALETTKRRRDQAEREHRGALDAHSAAQQATTAAATTVAQVASQLEEVERKLDGEPARDAVVASLERVDAARSERDRAAQEADAARRALREATVAREARILEEREARHEYDVARDAVAALGPPARLGRDVSLVDEWYSLVRWASAEADERRAKAEELAGKAASVAQRVDERVADLVDRCRTQGVGVRRGDEPGGAARQALGQASADHDQLREQATAAEKLRVQLGTVESRRDVARSLATHLDARHFEKWVLDEALTALAEGATEVLGTLSGGQYALRVDKKSGGFVVVDHRNAGEVRSARTLSGGETFLASLALALALADRIAVLAANGVARLESIFLDEGFGTLDADTLDVVTSAIEELGASGRLVGVVSHVADLAERLPVRFEVTRTGNASTIVRVDR
jgi:DNA repair protein SbcC/Rad50